MAQVWKSKYGTSIDISGLTPEQIKRVQSTAQDKGAYGTKAIALADSFRKAKPKATTPTTTTPGAVGGAPDLGINSKTGTVDPTKATGAIYDATVGDTTKNFNLNNPGTQVDASGNTRSIEMDPVTGQTKIIDKGGASRTAAETAFTNAVTGLGTDGRKTAQDATYNYLTRYDATDKAREMEDAKQELAIRGIPIDPSKDSLWSKTLEGIERKYNDRRDQANNQALLAGNQVYSTNVGAVNTLGATLAGQSPAFTAFQGAQSQVAPAMLDTLKTIVGFDAQRYQVDKQYKAEMDRIAVQRLAASKVGSGGGGGGGDGGSPFIIGGEAP